MTENATQKIPIWYWVVGILALLWNGLGVNQYIGQAYKTESWKSQYTAEQIEMIANSPSWLTGAFALAVFCGLLGALCLLIKKKWAYILFIISAVMATIQHGYLFASGHIKDAVTAIMPMLVIVVCILLVILAKSAIAKQWIK